MAKNISFQNSINPTFTKDLKQSVDAYFTQVNKKSTGDWRIFHKTLVLLAAIVTIYCLLLFAHFPVWANVVLCALLGFVFALIGFNVMHDGAHGSYSDNKSLNNLMGFSLNLMGGSTYFWKVKHNIIHHTYTNIDGHDDDIDVAPYMRLSKTQAKKPLHKYQHLYAVPLYFMTYIFWIYFNDFKKYFTGKILEKAIPKMTTKEKVGFWATKIAHLVIFVVIPSLVLDFKTAIIGYIIACLVCGLFIAVVFQLAHVVEDAEFPVPNEANKIEENWFIHQLETTANFSMNSKLCSWLFGGLNFQVEHHLFPKISHIHYPAISKIVQEVCARHNVTYNKYNTFGAAIRAHFSYLKQIGQSA